MKPKQALVIVSAVFAAALVVVLAAGCTTTAPWLTPSPSASRTPAPSSRPPAPGYPAMRNNSTVRLQAMQYTDDLRIRANSVTVVGQGFDKTIIRGTVIIDGNQTTIRDLTIAGNVIINGNSADLTGARIRGSVQSRSQTNRW